MTTSTLPVLALRNLVLFPGITVPIRVGRAQSVAAIRALRPAAPEAELEGAETRRLIAVLQKPSENRDHIKPDELHSVGVVCLVERVRGSEREGYHLVVKGLERVEISDVREIDGALVASHSSRPTEMDLNTESIAGVLESTKKLCREIIEFLPSGGEQMNQLLDGIKDLDFLLNLAAANLDLSVANKQALLEVTSLKDRALRLIELLQKLKGELEVRTEIRDKMTSKIGRNQREAILREQLRAIREELGEISEDGVSKEDNYRAKIESIGMPEAVQKLALDELKRLEQLGPQSPETHIIRNYLDLLTQLPWRPEPEADINLEAAREQLDSDHHGLDKIKKRILEHLAVMKLRSGGRGPILLFVGPPGVGKTSLGSSIAQALGRKFVRVSLGGVRDDAEIRGHRRTYIGAMPGRVIQGIRRAGSMRPVFMLDEIDKLARGFSGDPAAALLEVLDPEQNHQFHDHYLDAPYDLSKAVFIATANSVDGIPGPLLDRMEVIELSGYTIEEKRFIAEKHLVPKQLDEHGIKPAQLTFGREILERIITRYTREAGVRNLTRRLASVCRGVASKVLALAPDQNLEVTLADVDEILGQERFESEQTEKSLPPGVATGLAWTPSGGDILFIEASAMPGTGRLILTGQLGDVMKESAQIALSLLRSRFPQVVHGVEFEKRDIHLHVPAGAIPKDGPSAGVTILTSLASLFSGRRVDPRFAMTGEVSLRGAVMPVGGIKEKLIAAHRAGVQTVFLSRKNERDLREVPESVRQGLRIELVDDAGDILRHSLNLDVSPLDPLTGIWGSTSGGTPVA
jgi:ATP-dependent Lon protease